MATGRCGLPARTGIGGEDELETRGIAGVYLAASEGDHAGLQRRTKRLDDGWMEFRRLVEKEHTPVGT